MIRIWGDFNSIDLEGRIALDAKGSLEDIHKLGRPLRAGESVIVYDDSYQAEGTLDFRDGVWLARIDWKTGRDTLLVGLAEEMNRWGYPPLGLGRAMARVVIRLVRHVSRGEPVALNEIANVALEAGAPSSAVQQLVRRLCEMDHGRIVGIAGLSQTLAEIVVFGRIGVLLLRSRLGRGRGGSDFFSACRHHLSQAHQFPKELYLSMVGNGGNLLLGESFAGKQVPNLTHFCIGAGLVFPLRDRLPHGLGFLAETLRLLLRAGLVRLLLGLVEVL